ncbi:MAG: cytochrome [Thermoleophilia bacterium]|nr:cytochrome [Thermoleophilia bacterium]
MPRRAAHPDDHASHQFVPEGPKPAKRVPFPGPRGIAALRVIDQIRRDPLPVLDPLHQRWGDRIGVSALRYRFVLLSAPDDIEALLVGGAKDTMKALGLRQGRWMMGGQLLVAEGEAHARQRAILASTFARRQVDAYVDDFAEQAEVCCARWSDGATFEAERAMGDLDLAAASRTMFGGMVDGAEADAVTEALETCVHAFPLAMHPMRGVIDTLGLPPKGRIKRSVRVLNRTVKRLLDDGRARIARGEPSGHALAQLLEHHYRDDMSESEYDLLIDEVRGLLLGGHETLARSLAWGLHLLAEHPDVLARIRAEVEEVCGDELIRASHVEQLHEARRAFQETIRLYPAGGLHVRETQRPVRLDEDTVLDPGLQVAVPVWLVHRDPRWWPEPERFDPDRFIDPDPDRPRWAYSPWGGGARVCIGQWYATVLGTILIATVARRWQLEVAPESRAEAVSIFTVRSRHGLPLVARALAD